MANNHLLPSTSSDYFDKEWVDLIKDAKIIEISRSEIRSFLTKSSPNKEIKKSS